MMNFYKIFLILLKKKDLKRKKKLDDDEKDKLINDLQEENQRLLLEIENQKLNFENLQHQVVGIDIPKTSNEYDNNTNINNDDLKKIIEKYENEIKQQKEKEENMIIEYNIINETNDKLIDKLNRNI